MIRVDVSRLGDADLERLAVMWMRVCKAHPTFDPATTARGEFLWSLACELLDELGDRSATLHAMAVDLGEVGELLTDPESGEPL